MSSHSSNTPQPATSLVCGELPDGRMSFLFVGTLGKELTYRFFFGRKHQPSVDKTPLVRHAIKVRFTLSTEDDGSPGDLTVTWPVVGERKDHTLVVPNLGTKASLDGEQFTIERCMLPELAVPVILRQLGAARPTTSYK